MKALEKKRVAMIATDGFEEHELTEPKRALEQAGATVDVVSDHPGKIKAWNDENWGKSYPVDKTIDQADQKDYNALVIPGGVHNPDRLRSNDRAVKFVRSFFNEKKPVASICHGPWMLAEAGVLKNRKITSYPSIRTDMINAGAQWVDEEVVVDNGLVTSRSPKDLKAFNTKLIEEFAEGKHAMQTA